MGKKKQEEVYHVEVITKARVSDQETGWEYYVKWAGYDSDADSWEPSANVEGCQRLLASFWEHVGTDDDDHPAGYEVAAHPRWIKKEKKFFAKEFCQAQEMQKKRAQEEKEKEQARKADKKKSTTKKASPVESSRTSVASLSKGKGKAPKASETIDITSSEEEEDEPLLKITIPGKRPRAPSSSDEDFIPEPPRKQQKTSSINTSRSDSQSDAVKDKGKQKAQGSSATTPPPHSSPTSLFSAGSSPVVSSAPRQSGVPAPIPLRAPAPAPKKVKPPPPRKSTLASSATLSLNQKASHGSTLSTKQRLAQNALIPTNPKVPIPASLSFKKKPPGPPAASGSGQGGESNPHVPEFTSTPATPPRPGPSSSAFLPAVTQPSPSSPSNFFTDTQQVIASPTSVHNMQDQISTFDNFGPYSNTISPQMLFQQPRDDLMDAATDFLDSIMPPELAGPLTPSIEVNSGPMPPPALVPAKPPLPKIQKKWKWSGPIYIDAAEGESERLCDATITDPTDHLPSGLRFSILMNSVESLRFGSFHGIFDLDSFLLACKSAHQLAKLGPEAGNANPFKVLASYMTKNQQIILSPLSLDDAIVAFLLIFSPAAETLCRRFRVPKHLQQTGTLVAALVPWGLSSRYQIYEWRKPFGAHDSSGAIYEKPTIDKSFWERTLRSKRHYHLAIRALGFPKTLHEYYMSQPNRTFCAWWEAGDGNKNEPGMETMLLLSVMRHCKAKNVGHKADVRAVFVHVGALKTLHRLPALVERRTKRPEISFFTYGTHESVPRERWGFHEIYPIGGIVTFTPSALVEDPVGVFQRIAQIVAHPLWECYLLPAVLGMVAKLTSRGDDPLFLFDKGEFLYQSLLRSIDEGEVAMIQAPPLGRSPTEHKADPVYEWISKHLLPSNPRTILEDSIKAFNARFSNVQESEWNSVIEEEISSDLSSMQMQPAIMDEYRRYVVIKAERDEHISWNKDGFEWVPLDKFDFKDDFFPKSKPKETVAIEGVKS